MRTSGNVQRLGYHLFWPVHVSGPHYMRRKRHMQRHCLLQFRTDMRYHHYMCERHVHRLGDLFGTDV